MNVYRTPGCEPPHPYLWYSTLVESPRAPSEVYHFDAVWTQLCSVVHAEWVQLMNSFRSGLVLVGHPIDICWFDGGCPLCEDASEWNGGIS